MKGGILRKTTRKITLFVMLNSFSFAGETPHHPDIISASIDTASAYVKHLQFDQALSLYEKTLKQLMFNENNNFELIADVYRKIGRTHRKLKNDKLFLEYMFLSSDILKNHLGENHQKVAESYNNIGTGYNEIGEHEKALDYFEKTLIIESKMDTPKVNICFNNIGTTYIKIGKYEEALMYLKKALKGNINEFGNVNVHVSTVLYNIAATYSYMKKYEETLDYYQKSLTMDKMIFGENHYYLAGTYAELGNVFFRMKDYSMALEKYIKSLEIFTSVYGNYHRSVGNSFRNIAITHQRIGNIDKSLTMIQKALFSFAGEKENSNALINPLQSKRTEHSDNLRALVNKGSILLNMGRKKQSVDTLSTAFNTLKIASNLMETLLKERQTETSKIILLKDHKSLYSKAVETAVILGELTEDTTYYESAFLFSERAKAAVISERLQESEAFFYSGIPDSAMSRKRSNEKIISLLKNKLLKEKSRDEPDTSMITQWKDDLFDRNRLQEDIEAELESNYPLYLELKKQKDILTVKDIQSKLEKNTALLEYAQCKSTLIIFVITDKTFTVKQLPIDSSFTATTTRYMNSIVNIDLFTFIEKSNALYNLLVKPIEQTIRNKQKLLIIPERDLLTLPFEALLTEKTSTIDFTVMPYLVKDYTIGYHVSSQLYINSEKKRK